MKLDQYFFVSLPGYVISGPDNFYGYCLCGYCCGREGFPDGSSIQTTPILKIEDGKAYTLSGSVYELGSLNPDYIEMMEAEKNGIPVIKNWTMERDEDAFFMRGLVSGHGLIKGKITAQHGNYVTLDGKECFVVWVNCAEPEMLDFMFLLYGNKLGLKCEKAWNAECRPNLGLPEK